jgi:hypothetical protein
VRAYCAWLAVTPDSDGWQGDPSVDPLVRDHAARDFRRYLQVERRAAEAAPIRARSLVIVLLFTALRISESVFERRV